MRGSLHSKQYSLFCVLHLVLVKTECVLRGSSQDELVNVRCRRDLDEKEWIAKSFWLPSLLTHELRSEIPDLV